MNNLSREELINKMENLYGGMVDFPVSTEENEEFVIGLWDRAIGECVKIVEAHNPAPEKSCPEKGELCPNCQGSGLNYPPHPDMGKCYLCQGTGNISLTTNLVDNSSSVVVNPDVPSEFPAEIKHIGIDLVDEFFPKGVCKERGQAIVLYAQLIIRFQKLMAEKDNIIKNLARLLEQCKGAISDAIYCEDGLDGGTGEDIIKEIEGVKDLDKLTTCQECDYMIQANLKMGAEKEAEIACLKNSLNEIANLKTDSGNIKLKWVKDIAERGLKGKERDEEKRG